MLIFAYFIISFIPCNFNLCNLEYNEKYYIDNIIYFFSNLNILKVILFLLSAIFLGLLDIFENYFIDKYNVCYFFLIF